MKQLHEPLDSLRIDIMVFDQVEGLDSEQQARRVVALIEQLSLGGRKLLDEKTERLC